MSRRVEQGAKAEERDLRFAHRGLERAEENEERPKKTNEELKRYWRGIIKILTDEKLARSSRGKAA